MDVLEACQGQQQGQGEGPPGSGPGAAAGAGAWRQDVQSGGGQQPKADGCCEGPAGRPAKARRLSGSDSGPGASAAAGEVCHHLLLEHGGGGVDSGAAAGVGALVEPCGSCSGATAEPGAASATQLGALRAQWAAYQAPRQAAQQLGSAPVPAASAAGGPAAAPSGLFRRVQLTPADAEAARRQCIADLARGCSIVL
jgi:hypothetical protein